MKKFGLYSPNGNGFAAIKKGLIIMKITLLLILISAFNLLATDTYSQTARVSLKLNQTAIKQALKEIEKSSEFYFLYNNELVDVERKVDLIAENEPINYILDKIFENQEIKYEVYDRQIVISPVNMPLPQQPGRRVSGKVTDSSGTSLPGVSVVLKGTTLGVITDTDGGYSISNVPENGTLQFSFVGMEMQEIPTGGKTILNIVLTEETVGIEEVVAVGYGTQRKVNMTGAVSTVSSTELVKRPAHNVGNLLQGKSTGLQITQSSGQPGNDNPQIRIRGLGTFSGAGSDPLVLIDGIQGNLSLIDAQNIESVSVLKDAASASIYGARAANGVILITTKQGKAGTLDIQYSGNYQIQQPTRMPKFVTNSADFMTYVNQSNQRNGQVDYYSQAEISAFRNATDQIKYPNFDWVNHMIHNGNEQSHHLSLSGGNDKTKFNVSLGYLDQTGFNEALTYTKTNMMFNLKTQLNKVVSFGSNISLIYGNRAEPVMGANEFILLCYSAGPNYLPKLSDGSGRWTWRYNNPDWHNRNPEQALTYGNRYYKNYSGAAQVYVDLNLAKGLVMQVKGAVNYDSQFYKHQEHAVPSYFYVDNSLAALVTGYTLGVVDQFTQNILTTFYSTLDYTRSFNDHNFHGLLGYSQESNDYRYLKGTKQNFPTDNLVELDAGATDVQSVGGSSNAWAIRSFFGRLNYDFKGKYLAEANFRYDGTSRIAPDTRWGLFPSFSGAWRLSKENFMQDLNWIDNLKLRGSWGQLGNQNIGLYPYQDILSTGTNYAYAFSTVSAGAAVTRLTDKELKWEATTVTDFGFDYSMKKGLINVTFDWFNKVTDNILYAMDIPASIGLAAPTVNYAKMKNMGFEFEVGHSRSVGEVRYNVSFNFTTIKNEVLKVKAPSIGGTTIIQEGSPWSSYYLTEFMGIFQNQAEIDNSPKQQYSPKPGDLKFKDQNKDGVIDSKDRKLVEGAFPKFYYGGNLGLSWKNFDMNAFLQGTQGQKIYTTGWGVQPFTQGTAPTTDFVSKMWTGENSTNSDPAMYKNGYGPVTGTASTYFLQDASYLRLKNLQIGYNFSSDICRKVGMKNLRLYVSGDNLVTITKYPLADPEWLGGGYGFATYPQVKSFIFGVELKF